MRDPYDQVSYPSLPRPQTHPAKAAAIAAMAGLTVPCVENWRVLEIGCGNASNLLPLACEYPEARFVGVDRAREPLAEGSRMAALVQLSNIRLHAADLMDWRPEGEFDYIIAHGLYSWVPQEMRERLLEICQQSLAPRGLAYLSYNTLPGCHFRRFVWDLLRFHTRNESAPEARISRAREIAQLLRNDVSDDPPRAAIRKEMEMVLGRNAGSLYHDDLAETNTPFYLLDFVAGAGRHGLAYLGDAEPRRDNVRESTIRTGDWLEDRQYGDFLAARRFRETLLCRAGTAIIREPAFDRMRDLFAASRVQPEEPDADGQQKFALNASKSITTRHPLAKGVLWRLAAAWPASVRVADLPLLDHAPDDLAELLYGLLELQAIELRVTPPRVAPAVSERPAVSRLVRAQIEQGFELVTNQRHQSIELKDEHARALVSFLDGTRERAALARDLAADGADTQEVEQSLDAVLPELLRLCLLAA